MDKRVGLLTITAKGVELLENTPEPLHKQLSQKLKQLSPAELLKLQESFETIINFLNIEEVDAAPIITAEPVIPNKISWFHLMGQKAKKGDKSPQNGQIVLFLGKK